jgi:pyruvate dehydrogenase E2 component (dihydrolipoamide acetyltransferase)
MEALSPTMEEGRLVAWKKREGEAVKAGETLAEVETDKAVMELVARGEGVLRKRVLPEGATVPVGALVGIVGAPDEDIRSIEAEAAAPGARVSGGPAPAPAAPAAMPPGVPPAPAATAAGSRVRSSPLARRLARERGLDIGLISGTGPMGRVVKRDVDSAAPAGASPVPRLGPAGAAPRAASETRDVPLSMMRRTIATRLAQSIGPVPHFFLTREMDMERAAEARSHLKSLDPALQVSFNDLIIKAAALALKKHPAVNASFLGDHIRYHGDIHVGVAVALDDGLITPVIRHADLKGLAEIAAEARSLAERARARKLTPDEYTGATISISNLGMQGIDEFTAVINPPEAAILAVGRIAQRPVAVDGALVARRTVRITMSCDHRVIDGATGARYLETLALMLENPLAMLW